MICSSWQQLLSDYEHPLISRQYEYVSSSDIPHIVDRRITEIPIVECDEPLLNITAEKNPRIQMLPTPGSIFLHPDYNSGLPNASKMRKSVYKCFVVMLEHLDTLAKSFGYTPGQVSIRVFEGLRDIATQKTLFEKKLAEIRREKPELSEEELEKETCKWISPVKDNIPVHSTGAAVDIRLWDENTNDFVDMGHFGAIWGKNENAPTFSDKLTPLQRTNRYYMLLAAAKADLTNYLYEFWHFSHGDRYAAFWNKTQAKYSSIDLQNN